VSATPAEERPHASTTRPDRATWRLAPLVAAVAMGSVLGAASLGAQDSTGSLLSTLGIDRLRLRAVGMSAAYVKPSQIEATESSGVHADYGEVVPRWHLVFGVSYWHSRFEPDVVQRFADSLRAIVVDPTGDAQVDVGTVRVSSIAVTADARWSPRPGRPRLRPYLGLGLGAHAQNAEGRPVSGTFIESALDNIVAGVAASAGADVLLLPNLSLGMQARYDLLSGSRFASLRASASYVFRGRNGS
jgi:hypothetical protein